jgi:hypothetical protein
VVGVIEALCAATLGSMTLIAAELVGGQIRMGSDTEPTDPYGAPRKFLDQLLKIVLLHPGLCVAYAGKSGPALEAIRDLGVDPHTGFDLGHVCRCLKSAHLASGKESDFIVASMEPGPSLIRIVGGKSIPCEHQALLGSDRAMRAYRVAHAAADGGNPDEDSEQTRALNRIEAAIESVIEDPQVEGVGGICIRVASKPQGFVYLNQGIVADAQAVLPGGSPAGTYVMPLAGTAEGGHRYVLMTPERAGIGALGLYYQPGNVGLLMYPAKQTQPFKFSDVTQEQFIDGVRRATGLILQRFGRLDPM